jgi:HEPN domain-containing protein
LALPNPVRKWLRFALDDLKIARAIESMGTSYWRGCAYHSQQAVEKAIKGYLTFKQIRFSKTHDIATLVETVKTVDPELAKLLSRAKRLTKFAIEYRYPDAANRPMTKAKAKSARALPDEIYELISARLQQNQS